MKHLPLFKIGLTFIIPFMFLIIVIPAVFPIELNQTMTGLFALGALLIMGVILLYQKVGHQGNSPLFIGGAILGLSAIPIISSISFQGSVPIIELDARTQGFSFIGMAIGAIFIVIGAKTSLANQYWWGRGGR